MRVNALSAVSMSCSVGSDLGNMLISDRTKMCSYMLGYLVRENSGKNAHALLMAPKPDSKPRIMVPKTIRRDRAAVIKSEDDSAAGRGMYERPNRYSRTGKRLSITRLVTFGLRGVGST